MKKGTAIALGTGAGVVILLFLAVVLLFVMTGSPAQTSELAPAAGLQEAPAPACEFAQWVGKPGGEIERDVKATGRPYRLLKPGQPMTMDYRQDRINVEMDDDGIVVRVFCG